MKEKTQTQKCKNIIWYRGEEEKEKGIKEKRK